MLHAQHGLESPVQRQCLLQCGVMWRNVAQCGAGGAGGELKGKLEGKMEGSWRGAEGEWLKD